jgi:hypothetical protein
MTIKRAALGFAGAFVLSAGTACGAQAAATEFMEGFKVDAVSAILTDLKATDMKQSTVENEPRLTFKLAETIMVADFYSCEDKAKGCKVLQFMITYEPDASDTVQAVNEFNRKYLYGKATVDKTEGLVSYRMVNGHAGVMKGQIIVEFGAFLGATEVLLEHMKTSNVTAQASGAPAPALLNTAALRNETGENTRWASAPKNKRH